MPDVVFSDFIHDRTNDKTLSTRLNTHFKRAGVSKVGFHGFRHTHASLLFESGASIKEVQERLGHKDVKTTMNIYTHVTPEKVRETGERFAKYVNF